MPAVRHIRAVPDLGVAVLVGTDPNTGDEAWLIDPAASVDQIVEECSEYLEIANARCDELVHKGQRRALWLFLAVVAGLVLPSPLRHLYGAHHWLLQGTEALGYIAVAALLGLALHEHLGMRRLRAGD